MNAHISVAAILCRCNNSRDRKLVLNRVVFVNSESSFCSSNITQKQPWLMCCHWGNSGGWLTHFWHIYFLSLFRPLRVIDAVWRMQCFMMNYVFHSSGKTKWQLFCLEVLFSLSAVNKKRWSDDTSSTGQRAEHVLKLCELRFPL